MIGSSERVGAGENSTLGMPIERSLFQVSHSVSVISPFRRREIDNMPKDCHGRVHRTPGSHEGLKNIEPKVILIFHCGHEYYEID